MSTIADNDGNEYTIKPAINMCKGCCFSEINSIRCTRPKELDKDSDECAFNFIYIESVSVQRQDLNSDEQKKV
jgi:hypothetical protein